MNYQIVCINLERRADRKRRMTDVFAKNSISNYRFFNAFDGQNLDLSLPDLRYFRHEKSYARSKGVLGCSLSHLAIWRELLADPENDRYVVLEDDVNLVQGFKTKLEDAVAKLHEEMDFVLIGMTVGTEYYHRVRDVYNLPTDLKICPLTNGNFAGGFFGYVISKECVRKIIQHIDIYGIKDAIDFIVLKPGNISIYETHPLLVFTDSVQYGSYDVDSDIQYCNDKINLFTEPRINPHRFDDYDFYPLKDSFGYDILHSVIDIPTLKAAADSLPECQGFNTYGWLKYGLVEPSKYTTIDNKYHVCDGLYVKKNYHEKFAKPVLQAKLDIITRKKVNGPIKFYLSPNCLSYTRHIIDILTAKFPGHIVVADAKVCDIFVAHITEDVTTKISNETLNIMISGDPWYIGSMYDISIDTKYENGSKTVLYYPFLVSSIREHAKSIDPIFYPNNRSKFCAYMYNQVYPHRVAYNQLFNRYKPVDALGECCKDRTKPATPSSRYTYNATETYNDIAVQTYTDYKFVLAIENNMIKGYSTEKLLNPLIANSIPIYWGDSDIFTLINKRRVVYVPDFETDELLLQHIIHLDNDDAAYQAIVNEPIFVDPNFSIDAQEQLLSSKIDDLFSGCFP